MIDDLDGELIEFIDTPFNKEIFSLNDIALVHATDYFLVDGVIKTAKDSKVVYEMDYVMESGNEEKFKSYSHRDSLHFALNGKVDSHAYGNWDNRKYIIIDPIKHHLDSIHAISPQDTWTKGSIKLSSDSIVLVIEKEYDSLDKQLVENCNIIKYTGDSKKCVEKMLLLLGYKPQEVGKDGWLENNYFGENASILTNYVAENCPDKSAKPHFYSEEYKAENKLGTRDEVLGKIRGELLDTSKGVFLTNKEFNTLYMRLKHSAKDCQNPDYEQPEKDIFIEFIKMYGISYNSEVGIYLLDDSNVIKSYQNGIDANMAEEFYQFYEELKKKELEQENEAKHI